MANNKASEFEKWRNFKTNKKNTPDWYKNYKNKDVYGLCRNHIEKYSLLQEISKLY